jgi:hypothetical protein
MSSLFCKEVRREWGGLGLFPTDLEEDGPFSIRQQFRAIRHPETRAAERNQLLYLASRYLDPWDAEGMDGWTGNFKASDSLCHGFGLHLREVLQLLHYEFNPRLSNPLSDWDLWKVILARARTGSSKEKGWLTTQGRQSYPLPPRTPRWMAGRTDVMFWVPDPEIKNRWIEKVARRESSQVTDFAFRVLALRSWQEHEDTKEGPPLYRTTPYSGTKLRQRSGSPTPRWRKIFSSVCSATIC